MGLEEIVKKLERLQKQLDQLEEKLAEMRAIQQELGQQESPDIIPVIPAAKPSSDTRPGISC